MASLDINADLLEQKRRRFDSPVGGKFYSFFYENAARIEGLRVMKHPPSRPYENQPGHERLWYRRVGAGSAFDGAEYLRRVGDREYRHV